MIEKFQFRIHTDRTDRGHEFQAKFYWRVENQGIRHAYIKPRSPQLDGKVERSHRSDGEKLYQLLTYTDDVDLTLKLQTWEDYYNFNRHHGSLDGQATYKVLKDKLTTGQQVSSVVWSITAMQTTTSLAFHTGRMWMIGFQTCKGGFL